MDRRRVAGALLALAVWCIAGSDAAPTASNQTSLDLYDGPTEGCYYNFQHYGEGDRIMTNEPCLNCTCHNRMLMCYLRVCPFTKPIGQDCTVEKRADQCCPIVTCPDVPVDLLTSTSTTSPAEYGATGLGKLDKYGCSINGKYFPEGSKVPPTPNKPCEHCYCIRNMTTCVMQECTLHVDGCTPIYHKDVCCPVRYSCDHPEDEIPLLDDMTTTVRPTPGFLLTTTTLSPVTQMSQDCVHDDQVVADGALIKTEKACEHCYCMKGDIVCVVQECGTPMENEGKNCTSIPPREGQCCPDTYICEGDEVTTEPPSELTTKALLLDELTTLSPPRRVGVEGSGYRNEPDEPYTEAPTLETELEGSGYEQTNEPVMDIKGTDTTHDSMLSVTTTIRTPTLEEIETTEPDKGLNTVPSGTFEEEESSKPTETDQPIYEEDTKTTTPTPSSKIDEIEGAIQTSDTPFATEITHKHEESSSTTQIVIRKEEELDEVTDNEKSTAKTTDHSQQFTTESAYVATSPSDEHHTITTEVNLSEYSEKSTTRSEMEQKETTTESMINISTHAEETKPSLEITTQSPDLIKTDKYIPTSEKTDISETTNIDNKENEVEDISRIPGEGDCLLNEVTYRNNSDVPSTSKCHTSCRCISSIIKCDPIICSPPPEYMDNCQPTFDTPDSCCPTYLCHTGETMPPQPHSQMSGTESPASSPTIECEGDQCSLSVDSPAIVSTKKPEAEDCGTDCSQAPVKPPSSEERIDECVGDKCLAPTATCVGSACQTKLTQPCEGGKCVVEPEIVPVKDIPLCQNENDCKIQPPQIPTCEGEGCFTGNAGCGTTNCGEGAVLPQVSTNQEPEPCTGEKCQTTQDETGQNCEGDLCRRKEPSVHGSQIPECSSVECLEHKQVSDMDKKPSTVTESSEEGKVTEPTEKEKVTETVTEEVLSTEVDVKSQEPLENVPSEPQVPTNAPDLLTTSGDISEISTKKPELPTVSEEKTTIGNLPSDELPSIVTTQPEIETKDKIDTERTSSPQYDASTQTPYGEDELSSNLPTKPEDEKEVLETTQSSIIPKESTESEGLSTTGIVFSPVDIEPLVTAKTETPMKKPEVTTLKQLDEPIEASTELPTESPIKEFEERTTETTAFSSNAETITSEETFTKAPSVPEVHDRQTEVQEETSTKSYKVEVETEYPGLDLTIPENEDVEGMKVTEKPVEISTQVIEIDDSRTVLPVSQSTNKHTENEPVSTPSSEIYESSSIAEADIKHDVTTESHILLSQETSTPHKEIDETHVDTTQMPEIHITESDEKATIISDASIATEPEQITTKVEEGATAVTESQKTKHDETEITTSVPIYESPEPFTNALPTINIEDITNAPESLTTEVLSESSKTPDSHKVTEPSTVYIDRKEEASESPETLSTTPKKPTLITEEENEGTETPIVQVTEKQATLTPDTISNNEIKSESTTLVNKPESETETPTPHIAVTLEEEPQTVSVEDSVSELPDQSVPKEQDTKVGPEINEVLTPEYIPEKHVTEHELEIPETTPTSKIEQPITSTPDLSDNEIIEKATESQPSDYATDISADSVTEKQEISPAETYEKSPTTEEVPIEPFIPVHAEPVEPQAPIEEESITEIPDIRTESPTTEKQAQGIEVHTVSPVKISTDSEEEIASEIQTKSPETQPPEMQETQSYESPSQTPVTEKDSFEETPKPTESIIKTQESITEEPVEPLKEETSTILPEIQITNEPVVTKVQETTEVSSEEEKLSTEILIEDEQKKTSSTTEKPLLVPTIKDESLEEDKTTKPDQYTEEPEKLDTTDLLEITVHEEISTKQPEPMVTESLASLMTEIPESHIKETEQEEDINVPQEKTTQTPQDLVTVMLQELPMEIPKEKPSTESHESPHEKPHEIGSEATKVTKSPLPVTTSIEYGMSTEKQQELTTEQVQTTTLDVTEKQTTEKHPYDISTDTHKEVATEEPSFETTSASQVPEVIMTEKPTSEDTEHKEISTEKTSEVITQTPKDEITTVGTQQEEVTGQPQKMATESFEEISTTSPQELITDIPQLIDSKTPEVTTVLTESVTEEQPHEIITNVPQEIETPLKEDAEIPHEQITEKPEMTTDITPHKTDFTKPSEIIPTTSTEITDSYKPETGFKEDIVPVATEQSSKPKEESQETTPYLVELEEHTHKPVDEISTIVPSEELTTISSAISETRKEITTEISSEQTTASPEFGISDEKKPEVTTPHLPEKEEEFAGTEKEPEKSTVDEEQPVTPTLSPEIAGGNRIGEEDSLPTTPKSEVLNVTTLEDEHVPDVEIPIQTEKTSTTEKPLEPEVTTESIVSEEEIVPITSKATTIMAEEEISTQVPINLDEKPADKITETLTSSTTPESLKPGFNEIQPTDIIPDDENLPPSGASTGYGGQEPDYAEEDQAFGPGTCRYGGKVYVSAQQIPRDDPCDFCFCFRSDIICLQQSCPPPIHGCHEEPIQGFCCPRYECPVAMATTLNVTTTTTTTTTTVPPHFLPHAYKGAAQRRGCHIKGHTYKVGEVVRASSGPCLHCTCGGDGQMKCDPKACTPEPMLRQMIAAAVSAKRRR